MSLGSVSRAVLVAEKSRMPDVSVFDAVVSAAPGFDAEVREAGARLLAFSALVGATEVRAPALASRPSSRPRRAAGPRPWRRRPAAP